jgi:SulP family sulfate permease
VLVDISRPRDAWLRRRSSDQRFHDLDEDEDGESPNGVLVYRMYAPLIFANARHFAERVRTMVATAPKPVQLVVIDFQAVTDMDLTAIEALEILDAELNSAGIEVRFARANRPLRERLSTFGIANRLRTTEFFPSSSAAVDDYLAHVREADPEGSPSRARSEP